MKKVLFATSALVAFGVTAAAQAAEPIKLSVGGFTRQWVGYADNNNYGNNGTATKTNGAGTERNDFDVISDTEIHFKGSTKLDNGITVAVTVEMEGNALGGGHHIDEQYVTLSGGFGQVKVGMEDNVGALIHNAAPDVGLGINNGVDAGSWVLNPMQTSGVSGGSVRTSMTYIADDTDAEKIIYISPAFAGFQVGVSYTPDITAHGDGAMAASGADLWVAGVAYNNTIAGVGVKADVGFASANGSGNNVVQTSFSAVQGGLNLSYAGFTLGGSYVNRDEGSVHPAASRAGNAWDIGLSYTTGPYSVSATYLQGSAKGTHALRDDDEQTIYGVSGAYNMGPGVDLKASIFHAEFDSEATTTSSADNKGWAVVTGIAVAF